MGPTKGIVYKASALSRSGTAGARSHRWQAGSRHPPLAPEKRPRRLGGNLTVWLTLRRVGRLQGWALSDDNTHIPASGRERPPPRPTETLCGTTGAGHGERVGTINKSFRNRPWGRGAKDPRHQSVGLVRSGQRPGRVGLHVQLGGSGGLGCVSTRSWTARLRTHRQCPRPRGRTKRRASGPYASRDGQASTGFVNTDQDCTLSCPTYQGITHRSPAPRGPHN